MSLHCCVCTVSICLVFISFYCMVGASPSAGEATLITRLTKPSPRERDQHNVLKVQAHKPKEGCGNKGGCGQE